MATLSPDTAANPRRLPAGRKVDVAGFIAEVGQVTVAQLAEHFDVSLDTVRRDLDQLDADGLVVRTHGGAVSPSGAARSETGLEVRRRLQTGAKDRIGELAARLVQDGSTVMLNGGTTVLAAVRAMREHRDLTVATNNLVVPSEMPPGAARDIYLFGGPVRLSAQATVGPVVFRSERDRGEIDVHCDIALIAVGAACPDHGYTVSNLAEAAMMREMMDKAVRVAVLVDSSKLGRRLFAQVAALDRADYLVTDAEPSATVQEALRGGGVELVV